MEKRDTRRFWISFCVEIILTLATLVLACVAVRTANDSHTLARATIRADSLMVVALRKNEEAERVNQDNFITQNRAYLHVKAVEFPSTMNDSSIEVAIGRRSKCGLSRLSVLQCEE